MRKFTYACDTCNGHGLDIIGDNCLTCEGNGSVDVYEKCPRDCLCPSCEYDRGDPPEALRTWLGEF